MAVLDVAAPTWHEMLSYSSLLFVSKHNLAPLALSFYHPCPCCVDGKGGRTHLPLSLVVMGRIFGGIE
jgi:hypothetical protein